MNNNLHILLSISELLIIIIIALYICTIVVFYFHITKS